MIDPLSSKTIGYHLFLEPIGELADNLINIIQKLSAEYGGPVFAPHVTLLARIIGDEKEVIAKSQSVADGIQPFTLTLGKLDAKDAFFKALYILIKETGEMEQYHTRANTIFSMQDEGIYTPHLSLLYGNYDEKRKLKTMENIVTPKETSFAVDRIHLYKTEGETENWIKVKEFVLKI